MAIEEVVILVVGNETESKSRVADVAAQVVGASKLEVTEAGARIFTSTSGKPAVVESTTFLETDPAAGLVPTARQWISQNSLRRILFGKIVFVVCVFKSSPAMELTESNFADSHSSRWLEILGVIFKEQKEAIILVNTQNSDRKELSRHNKEGIEDVLKSKGFSRDIKCVNWHRGGDSVAVVKSIVEANVHLRNPRETLGTRNFRLKEVSDSSETKDRFGPWGPERVILFGRAGSGKSTLAQMLTTGKLDPNSTKFVTSSSARGATKRITHGEGRGWYVVDTPGFGEPKDEQSTMPTREAEHRVKNYVKMIEGVYSHYLFVVQKDRIDKLEVRLWKFFVSLFGANISDHFSVVVSNGDSEWLQQNLGHLEESFKGCNSFLCAEFPSIKPDDEEWETELQEVRLESLKEIENSLARLARNDIYCHFGKYSQTAVMSGKPGGNASPCSVKGVGQKALGVAKRVYFEVYVSLSGLVKPVTINDAVELLPG